MRARPFAAFTVRPVHKQVVKRAIAADMITVLSEGESLSVRSMRRSLKVLKQPRANEPPSDTE